MKNNTRKSSTLVTGALGYIGLHLCLGLMRAERNVIALYRNPISDSDKHAIPLLEGAARLNGVRFTAIQGTVLDAFGTAGHISNVVHLAGHKGAATMERIGLEENINWVSDMLPKLMSMEVRNIIFASSGSVYLPSDKPVTESDEVGPLTAYAWSKLKAELALAAACEASTHWNATVLRYFNPIGAVFKHQPNCIEDAIRNCIKTGETIPLYTDDPETRPNGFVRDYISMDELVRGTILALDHLEQQSHGYRVFNIGTGVGTSTRDLIAVYEEKHKFKLPFTYKQISKSFMPYSQIADMSHTLETLGFNAKPITDPLYDKPSTNI